MRRREFIAGLASATAWPLPARAQQPAMPAIGYLSSNAESAVRPYTAAFRRGLGEQGFVEGRNVEIVYRWTETRYERLPAFAAELVRRGVAVIFATGGGTAPLAAKAATTTIPIVFHFAVDPVELRLVASLNRPGGNVTGVTFLGEALVAKRLELLHEIVPAAKSIAFLVNPTAPQVDAEMREAEIAARALGVRLVILKASTPSEIEAVFAILVGQRIGALLEASDSLFFEQSAQIIALAARHAVPAIYFFRDNVEASGLISYGANFLDSYRVAGTYVGRILNGETPADLPVQQSTRFEMVLNLKTAKMLGLEVPTSILLRADEVIE